MFYMKYTPEDAKIIEDNLWRLIKLNNYDLKELTDAKIRKRLIRQNKTLYFLVIKLRKGKFSIFDRIKLKKMHRQ